MNSGEWRCNDLTVRSPPIGDLERVRFRAVGPLMDNLACDPRHRDMHVLGLWTTADRLFGGWSMACAPVMDASDVTGNLVQRATCGLQLVGVLFQLASVAPLIL